MTNLNDNIPELKIEYMNDGMGEGLILLEQDDHGSGEGCSVAIHPIHLRYIVEKMGLLPAGDPQAQKTIATLQRRMVGLHERIEALADWMAKYSDHKHADLTYETTQLNALADLAREWCHDFDESEQATPRAQLTSETSEKPPECKPAPAPAPAAQGSLL